MWTPPAPVDSRASDVAALFSDAQLLAAVVDASEDALVATSATGHILSWNAGAERLFGFASAEALGRHISLVIPADRVAEEQEVMRRLLAGDRVGRFETVRHRKDGEFVAVELSLTPVKDAEGRIVGAVTVARDIRERTGAMATLREEEERRRLSEELRRLSEELTLTNRRKDEFLSALSHQIRNPLGAIRTGISIMKSTELSAAVATRTHAMVERQVAHLARLLDDLLDVSRSTHGHLSISLTDIDDVRTVIEEAIAATAPMFDAAGVTVSTTLPHAPLPGWGDPARLQQLVVNVLSNAARYTLKGGRADLTARAEGMELVIEVADSGVGIPADLLPQVFELFAQRQPDTAAATSGLGIGLYLTRELAARHGGTVSAASEGPGHGSTFTIRLPVLKGAGETTPPDGKTTSLDGGAPTVARRVLVVDDDRDNADGLAMLIRLSGHEAEIAHDGTMAIEKVSAFHPDVVLLDIGLPGMDGIETCRRLRDLHEGPRPFVVAVTGWGQPADYERTRAAGFDQHLVKPVEPQRLLALLSNPADRAS